MRFVFPCMVFFVVTSIAQFRAPEFEPHFIGNAAIGSSELRSTLKDAGLLTFRSGLDTLVRSALEREYRHRGYYFASVVPGNFTTEDSIRYTANVTILEGPIALVGTILFAGNNLFPAPMLLREMSTSEGDVFSETILSHDLQSVAGLYDQKGYPFAVVTLDGLETSLLRDTTHISITIRIDEGEQFLISEFTIEGNTQTHPSVIIRETRMTEDDLYSPDKVNEIRPRLERLGFFSSVSEPELYRRGNKGGLLLRVQEGNTNRFDGVIGYQPPRFAGETGSFTGLINLSFRNLFGTGRRFDARWERASSFVSELEVRYLEPWLFGFPFNIQGGFFQRQQDSAYVRRILDGKVTFLATQALHVSASLQVIDVIADQQSTVPTLVSSSMIAGSLELLIDTRDNVYNPRSGIILRNGYTGGNKSLLRNGVNISDYLQRIEIDAATFLELFPRHIGAVSLHGRELRGSELDISDFFRLGGANTLRGYREEQFLGTRLGWLNLEYRYTIGRRSYAFAFFDLGYIFLPASRDQLRKEFTAVQNGYGFGARLETALGIIGVSYALGEGDSISNGKIHFGLVNEF